MMHAVSHETTPRHGYGLQLLWNYHLSYARVPGYLYRHASIGAEGCAGHPQSEPDGSGHASTKFVHSPEVLFSSLMKPSATEPGPTIMRANFSSTERTVKKSLFRIWRQQEDLPDAAFLP